MKKFLNFSKVLLVLCLVLTVGVIPTVARASEVSTVSISDSCVYWDKLYQGEWLNIINAQIGGNYARADIYDDFDQSTSNSRILYEFTDVNFQRGYTTRLDSSFILGAQGTEYEYISIASINNAYCRGYYDGAWHFIPVTIDWNRTGAYFGFSITYGGMRDIEAVQVIFEFNVHTAFGSDPWVVPTENFYLQTGGQPEIVRIIDSSVSVPSVDVPVWDGEYDLDDLPPLDEFVPDDSNPLMVSISKFTNLPVITDMLLVVSVMGVLAYVVFGKRS